MFSRGCNNTSIKDNCFLKRNRNLLFNIWICRCFCSLNRTLGELIWNKWMFWNSWYCLDRDNFLPQFLHITNSTLIYPWKQLRRALCKNSGQQVWTSAYGPRQVRSSNCNVQNIVYITKSRELSTRNSPNLSWSPQSAASLTGHQNTSRAPYNGKCWFPGANWNVYTTLYWSVQK